MDAKSALLSKSRALPGLRENERLLTQTIISNAIYWKGVAVLVVAFIFLFIAYQLSIFFALIGVLTGRAGEVPTSALMAKQARLQGLIVGSRRQQQDYVAALDRTGIRPVIDRTYAFAELPEAFRHQESGSHFGKLCVAW